MTDDISNLSNAISLSWRLAHLSTDREDWVRRWGKVMDQLEAVRSTLIYFTSPKVCDSLSSEIRTLWSVALENMISYPKN